MKKFIVVATVALILSSMLLPGPRTVAARQDAPAGSGYIYRTENPLPEQYLVVVRNNIEAAQVPGLVYELANTYGGVVLSFPYESVSYGFSVQMTEQNALALSRDQRVEFVQEIPRYGFESAPASGDGSRTNVALAVNGGQAFASSTLDTRFPVSSIINGETMGAGWEAGTGGWHDATGANFPDYLEIHFAGEKRINEVDLFTLQDNYNSPVPPTQEMTFSQWGVTSFRVNYWNSTTGQWVYLTQVDGNDKVWRKIEFATVNTQKLSIMILGGANNHSRVVEIEAWEEVTAPEPAPEPAATQEEIALTADFPWDENTKVAVPAAVPVDPLGKAANPWYFRYGSKTMPLFGMSGSFLPHIKRKRPNWNPNFDYDPIKENCTLDNVTKTNQNGTTTTKPKYQFCVDALKDAGLNHLQIWVSLNHSVGMSLRERRAPNVIVPYNNEQPFKWVDNKWDLYTGNEGDNLDPVFFQNLRSVIEHCQSRDVMVAVVLFDPWQGMDDNIPSPYYKSHNGVSVPANNVYKDGVEFSNRLHLVMASDPNADPESSFIDAAGPNRFMRNVQIAVMQRTVQALQGLKNFYWVLANEPDYGNGAYGKRMIVWHRYMTRILRAYDSGKNGGKPHLIAANLASNRPRIGTVTAADDVLKVLAQGVPLKPELNLDIITGHYVNLNGNSTPHLESERYSALRILNDFNVFLPGGARDTSKNNMRWGFTEGRTTGTAGDRAQTRDNPNTPFDERRNPLTAEAARVEAWEFFLNGGGIFDHLSYRWANPDGGNEQQPPNILNYYKLLTKFMSDPSFSFPFSDPNLKRMTLNQTNRWITNPPTYGPGKYWAAMSNGSTYFVFYQHRSTLAGYGADRYHVYEGTPKIGPKFTVRNLGCGTFRAEWFYPDGKAIGGLGGTLNPGTVNATLKPFGKVEFPMTNSSTRDFDTPTFNHDVVLRIVRLSQCN